MSDAEKNNKLLENRLVAQDWEHGQAIAERDQESQSRFEEQEKMHSTEMKRKKRETTVSQIIVLKSLVLSSPHPMLFLSPTLVFVSPHHLPPPGIDQIKESVE